MPDWKSEHQMTVPQHRTATETSDVPLLYSAHEAEKELRRGQERFGKAGTWTVASAEKKDRAWKRQCWRLPTMSEQEVKKEAGEVWQRRSYLVVRHVGHGSDWSKQGQ